MERASTDRHPPVHVGLLGRVRATVGGREVDLGGARQRALLAALGVRAGRTVSTDALIDAVWDGEPPDAAERTFRTYVARLRRSFDAAGADGTAVILTDAAGYRLDDATVAVDARRFEDEIPAARTRLNDGEAAVAAQQVAEALELWEGEALGEFADRSWAAPAASSLTEARTVARELP